MRSSSTHTPANTAAPEPLPPILFVADIARLLSFTRGAARKAVSRGELGDFGRVGRRLFVRREVLLTALGRSETRVSSTAEGRR